MEKLVFFNVGWMKNYQGLHRDSIRDGGSFVAQKRYGLEIFNFLPVHGRIYGAVETSKGANLNLARLGGFHDAESMPSVNIVWTARNSQGGTYIVGWYRDAKLFREYQDAPRGLRRIHKGKSLGYLATAIEKNCKLLLEDERLFKVPRGKGWMGQSNVWYCDSDKRLSFKKEVLRYIKTRELPHPKTRATIQSTGGYQRDWKKRVEVERAACERVERHFRKLGYVVFSVEDECLGWDFTAINGQRELKLEVKGLSYDAHAVELTPNEYLCMTENNDSYRICVVTGALSRKPKLTIFSYSHDSGHWEDDDGKLLKVNQRIAARLSWGS
jgi:hypothetical protein